MFDENPLNLAENRAEIVNNHVNRWLNDKKEVSLPVF